MGSGEREPGAGRAPRPRSRLRRRRLRRPSVRRGGGGARRRATARSRSGSPTARSSGCGRSTTRSRRSADVRSTSSIVPVRAALRLGAYELGFLDGVPARASVNEAVELVRGVGRAGGRRGSSNAVLRRVSERIRPLLAALPEETAEEAALKHSYPDWIAETWWREWGPEEALALMRAQNEPPETAVRVVETGEARVVDRIDPEAVEQGLVWPQSRGSQLAGPRSAPRTGERVLDLCAAPGGKTTQLAKQAAEVVAVEVHPGRARELEENVPPARARQRHGRQRRRPRAAARPDGLRPRARRRAVLGSRRARVAARPPLARPAAARAPAGAAARCGRAGAGPAARSRTPSARSPRPRTRTSSTRAGLRWSR